MIGDTDTVAAINAKLEQLIREQQEHRTWHHRTHKMALGVIGTVGGLVMGVLVWGATEFRGRSEAQAREQCREVAIQYTQAVQAEHSELRAADQRLADEQNKQSRELQQLAMHRLAEQREARPK